MKVKVTKFIYLIIGNILSILGFSGCRIIGIDTPWGGGAVCMYGAPYSTLIVKGTVTDEAKKPVEGIQVIIKPNTGYIIDTLYTDNKGSIYRQYSEESATPSISIAYKDVDGAKNGEFKDGEGVFPTKHTQKGKNTWDQGTFECSFDITLEKK